MVFTTITLVTGPLWAKPAWGVFWTWEPRLTTTLILWFIYVGYLLLRSVALPGHKRARLAAVYGIVGWIDVPIVFLSIWWWRTVHPRILGEGGFAMDAAMVWVLASACWRSPCCSSTCCCCVCAWRERETGSIALLLEADEWGGDG